MKHARKLSAIILSAIMLATGCASNTAPGGSTEIKDSTANSSENNESNGSNTDTVAESKSVKDVIGDIKVDTKVKILSWYDLNDQNVAKTYKELFGVPENTPIGYEESGSKNSSSEGNEKEKPFADIQVTNYASRYMDLTRLVQSDNSPDCIPFQESTFIRMLGKKEELLQNVDDVIDFGIKELALYKSESDKLSFEGKHYVPITDLSVDHMIWYKTSVIAESGLDDPWGFIKRANGHGINLWKCQSNSPTVKTENMLSTDTCIQYPMRSFPRRAKPLSRLTITADIKITAKTIRSTNVWIIFVGLPHRLTVCVIPMNARTAGAQTSTNGQKEIPYSISAINIIMKPNLVYIRKETSGAMMK